MCGTLRRDEDAERVDETIITDRGTKRITRASPANPKNIWMMPAKMMVAGYSPTPCSFTIGPITNAIEPPPR